MFQTVFHHNEELLERCIVRVERTSKVERRLDQAFDAQFGHVHQVKPFDSDGILRILTTKQKTRSLPEEASVTQEPHTVFEQSGEEQINQSCVLQR